MSLKLGGLSRVLLASGLRRLGHWNTHLGLVPLPGCGGGLSSSPRDLLTGSLSPEVGRTTGSWRLVWGLSLAHGSAGPSDTRGDRSAEQLDMPVWA